MNHSNRSYASVLAPSSMTRSANGNKSVHNQQESHTQDAQQLTKAQAQPKQALAIQSLPQKKTASPLVMDIGINLTNKAFKNNWKAVIRRAVDAGVHRIVLTGTSIECSRESLRLAHQWYEEEGTPNLCVTVGVHPHHANSWNNKNSLQQMRKLLEDPLAVAVGECGLDYNRNFSSRSDQCRAFRAQLELAHELDYPVFIHEREAHGDLLKVLDEVRTSASDQKPLPKIVVHCFTGTQQEAMAYIKRGYYIGFTGTICKRERGAHLRKLLPSLPLERLMVETDAPFMGFKKGTRNSEPADCVGVVEQLSESIDRPFEEVCQRTTQTAMEFFRLS